MICISKGKAHKSYEIGCKVSIITTNHWASGGQFVLYAAAFPGQPHDGHALWHAVEETEALKGRTVEQGYVDKSYRAHDGSKPRRVFRSDQKRGMHGQIKRKLQRRSAIEAVIGCIRADGDLGRNYLKGPLGIRVNALLSAVDYNIRLIPKWLRLLLRQTCRSTLNACLVATEPLSPMRKAF